MSAAATAAGYLYASGRLRGRNGRDNESHDNEHHRDNERHYGGGRGEREHGARGERAQEAKKPAVKVAVYHSQAQAPQAPEAPAPVAKKTPKIEYRTRRWRPE
jgi:hypothetical protein